MKPAARIQSAIEIIEEIIEETGAQSMADLGKVMPQIMKQGKGLIDGKTAQSIVSEMLG